VCGCMCCDQRCNANAPLRTHGCRSVAEASAHPFCAPPPPPPTHTKPRCSGRRSLNIYIKLLCARCDAAVHTTRYKGAILQAEVNIPTLLLSEAEQRYWTTAQRSTTVQHQPHEEAPLQHSYQHQKQGQDPLVPVPSGWQHFPGHCMSEKACTDPHCDCRVLGFIVPGCGLRRMMMMLMMMVLVAE
jgi:hypothetical protein